MLRSVNDKQDAGRVPIVDAGGYYTGTDVEAALQEAGAGDLTAYVLVDGTRAMTGDLEIAKVAPGLVFTDLGSATVDDDWTIGTSGNDLIITNTDSDFTGKLRLDHVVDLRPSPRQPVPNFTQEFAIIHQPTVSNTGAVQGYFMIRDQPTVTLGGAFNSYGVIGAAGSITSVGAGGTDAAYLFVNNMTSTATAGNTPVAIHSFDSRPVLVADAVAPNACAEIVALQDWTNVSALNSGTATLTKWATVSARPFGTFFFNIGATGAGATVTVTNRIGVDLGNVLLGTLGGTETIVNNYGIKCDAMTVGTTINCGAWYGASSGATSNYGIVLDGNGSGAGIWFGATQDSAVYHDGTDLIIDPDIGGSGAVLIGATGDDNLSCFDVAASGDLDMDGGSGHWLAVPRMTTTQRNTMTSGWGAPEAGREWFNTTTSQGEAWNGAAIVVRY